ncbi:uncharacterized protein LOC143283277 [Babylonia areolata]|uniref:uncharacterized protein LOC143283277 n=1 Tax=Babylonia areolata TaxID=304850 RepID=UPI003FD616AF
MRSIVAVVVCVCFLLATHLSFSAAQDCTSLEVKADCCLTNNTCVYVTCNGTDDNTVAGCFNSTEDAGCVDEAEAVDTCGDEASATTKATTDAEETDAPETVTCSDYNSNKSGCCAAANATACVFFTCNNNDGDVTGTVCTAAGEEAACGDQDSTAGRNECTEEDATNPATTAAPAEGETDNCSSYNTDQSACCAAGSCVFVNCTLGDGTTAETLCANASSTPNCTDPSATVSENICTEPGNSSTTPSDIGTPTQSPSGGTDEGGQQFDAASFIGGIVLCAGILAIGFFGLKFYRSRQERNYQSM